MNFPLSYDATITKADFIRLLPLATGEVSVSEVCDGVFRGVGWEIRLAPLAPLGIGLFRLERHRVEISFQEYGAAEQERFMRRFSQCFQRGGG